VKNSKNSGLSKWGGVFWERERAEEEEMSEGPGGALSHMGGAARARPRHLCVRWRGCPTWCLPGVSLPHFWHKNLQRIFWNFSRNFIFKDFSEIGISIKLRKT
jgi:hypothetical protein